MRPLKFSEYFGKNFDEYVTLKKAVTAMKTGKSGKKSSTIARRIVLRLVTDQHYFALVLRKQLLDHDKSTFPAIIKAFNKFQNLTGYNWRRYWTVNKGAKNPHIIHNTTGQMVRFVSFDRPESLAGLEMEDVRFYYGDLWFEEPMQIVDKNSSMRDTAAKEKLEEQNFDIIMSSAFRGTKPHPGAHREMTLSFNDWSNGDYWIINKYIKSFVIESEEVLDLFGKQMRYDPNYSDGKGILVLVGSGGLNEYNDDDYISFIKGIKKQDPEFYKAIWLGTSAQVIGNAYSKKNISQIKMKLKLEEIEEYLIGIDYSSSKDYIVIILTGFSETTGEIQIVDAWRYHRGKAKNPMKEPVLIKHLWEIIKQWRKKYNWSSSPNITEVHVDPRDATVRSFLQKYWQEATPVIKYDIRKPSGASKWNSASSFIRIMVTRYIMGAGKMRMNPALKWLLNEFKNRTFKKDGQIKDGQDDGPQAFEYCWSHQIEKMVPPIMYDNLIRANQDRNYEFKTIRENEG